MKDDKGGRTESRVPNFKGFKNKRFSKMIKIKEINQSYTMEEIKAIVDELYPFREYELKEKGEADANPAYCDKEDLLNLFLLLNKCNKKLAFSPIPLSAREKKQLMEERDKLYKQLQERFNPETPQPDDSVKPQPDDSVAKHERLITITAQNLEEFKSYFTSTFKGMGNNNPDRFTEKLIPGLQECFTKKDVANLLYACYKSAYFNGYFNQKNGKKWISWNKFKDRFCLLFSVERLPYKPNELGDELGEPDYKKFYWLEPPKNRQ